MTVSFLDYLQRVGSVPAADQAALLAAWRPRRVRSGEWLLEPGQVAQDLFLVAEGVLRVGRQLLQGPEATYFFAQAHELCTVLPSFSGQRPALAGVQAACPTQVLALARPQLDQLCQQFAYLPGLLHQLSTQALLRKLAWRNAYQGLDARARYALFLAQQPAVARPVPLGLIASYLGITSQSLSRLRKPGS